MSNTFIKILVTSGSFVALDGIKQVALFTQLQLTAKHWGFGAASLVAVEASPTARVDMEAHLDATHRLVVFIHPDWLDHLSTGNQLTSNLREVLKRKLALLVAADDVSTHNQLLTDELRYAQFK